MQELLDLLDESGVAYRRGGEHKHVREGWLGLDCPQCGPGSNRFHLGLNLRSLAFHCWRCGNLNSLETLEALGVASKPFWSLRRYGMVAEQSKWLGSKAANGASVLREPVGIAPMARIHRRYLERRGFEPSTLARIWALEGIGLEARLRWRIYIPITFQGVRVSWTTRAVGERVTPRYVSAAPDQEKIPHKQLVYGLDLCAHSVVIVEGPADAWRIGPGAGALFGTAFTTAQLKQLATIPKRFVCFDSEPAAQARARALTEMLSGFPGSTEVVQIDAKDPGSATKQEIRRLRRAAGLDSD